MEWFAPDDAGCINAWVATLFGYCCPFKINEVPAEKVGCASVVIDFDGVFPTITSGNKFSLKGGGRQCGGFSLHRYRPIRLIHRTKRRRSICGNSVMPRDYHVCIIFMYHDGQALFQLSHGGSSFIEVSVSV